jgi:hypothetical protein
MPWSTMVGIGSLPDRIPYTIGENSMKPSHLRPALLAGVAALSLSLVLAGCSASVSVTAKTASPSASATASSSDPSASSSGHGSATDKPENADVFTLAAGDCVNDASGAQVLEVPRVDCAAPHDYEVFYNFDIPADAYPGADAVTQFATTVCGGEFENFIGVPFGQSVYAVQYFTPSEESWTNGGDRTITCLAYDPAGQTTGTLANAGK